MTEHGGPRPLTALSWVWHSHRSSDTRCALSPARFPWVSPLTMLARRGLSFGWANVASMRPLPGAFPVGAPLDNVGTARALHCGGHAPNIVKDGTPQKAKERHPARGAVISLPVAPWKPAVFFAQRSAASRSRGLRREGREGLPDGARQRARWRSIAGRSRTPESDLEVGRGRKPKPVQRRRRCRRMHPASDCADPAKRIAPKVSLSVQYEPESRSHRSRDHGDDDEGEHAARGAALGAINTNRGVCGNRAARRPPQAGVIWSGGRRRMLAFGDDRHDKSCSRRQPRALGSSGRLPTPLPLRRRARTARA